jgi:hypothetical protein
LFLSQSLASATAAFSSPVSGSSSNGALRNAALTGSTIVSRSCTSNQGIISDSAQLAIPGGKFPALTGIRTVAAYLVFFHHSTPPPAIVTAPVASLLTVGHIGVALFYVLERISHRL